MRINIKNFLYLIVCYWIIISSVYYVNALFTGITIELVEENLLHKLIKYIICFLISLFFCFISRNYKLVILSLIFFSFSLFSFVLADGHITLFSTTMLIIGSMCSFCLLPLIFYNKINHVFIFSGILIGVFSILEITVFYDNMASYWRATGGIRSISSLLNPNNSGLYAGAIILLILSVGINKNIITLSSLILSAFTLVASGSRTAWVSLIFVFFLSLFMKDKASKNIKKYIPLFFIMGMSLLFLKLFGYGDVNSNIESQYRGLDLYTAEIRLQNFVYYLFSLDIDFLLPDFTDKRIEFIQDNAYLVLINMFGLVGFLFLFLFFMFLYIKSSMYRGKLSDDISVWKVIFYYFIISGISGSFINSFPVNQMFFISIGYFVFRAKGDNLIKLEKEAINV
ncbi:O-antigen polymerase [Photorhabdus tasmaniensis]|uniref:O-antigen polymerase n=1 Tax=Photorhabdus tasmaniensis TaxID=1004159 RepID=UPI00404369E8